MSEKDNSKKASAAKVSSAEQTQETGKEVTGTWWDRVPEAEKKKYNRAWLYHLYGDLQWEIADMKAVLK